MKSKKKKTRNQVVLFVCFLLFTILLFNLVNAQKDIVNKNIRLSETFDNQSLARNLISQTNFIGLRIIDNQVWAKVNVGLKDKSGIIVTGTKEERRKLVNQKIEWFESETDKVLETISKSEISGVNKHPEGFRALVTKKGFEELIKNKNVLKISWPQYKPELILDESALLINADDAWNTLGYTGDGVKVCVIDSGANASHPDLQNRITDEKCYNSDNECPDNTAEDDSAEDKWGHGTYTAGIVASEDIIYKGIAPDADLYIVRVTNDDGEYSSDPGEDIGDAIDWCRNQGVDVISMSFREGSYSSGNCPSDFDYEINTAYDVGITLIAGSGNDAEENKLGYPACSPNVTSVGATYDFGDGDYVYINESADDQLKIHASNLILDASINSYVPNIAAASDTDYVCVGVTGVLSHGDSCTRFEDLKLSNEQVTEGKFKIINIVSENYGLNHPLEVHRGKVSNYFFTIVFRLDSNTVEGIIKVPGNMHSEEIGKYLLAKIEQEQLDYAPVRKVVGSSLIGKEYDLNSDFSDFDFNSKKEVKK